MIAATREPMVLRVTVLSLSEGCARCALSGTEVDGRFLDARHEKALNYQGFNVQIWRRRCPPTRNPYCSIRLHPPVDQRAGKRREMGLGAYPQIGLKDARSKAEEQRSIIRSGIDPLTKSRDDQAQSKEALLAAARRAQNTLKFCALEYIEAHRPGWKNAKHAQQWHNTLTTYVFPFIGEKAIDEIDVDGVLQVLSPIWLTIPETAKRVRSRLELILDYAKAKNSGPEKTQRAGGDI
ncbi:Arm DNA-binding domain-containing protein [Pseudomonas corrugata]